MGAQAIPPGGHAMTFDNGSIELEANTMIGSALDLDSLSGQEDDAGSSTVASGSQIGLIGQQRGYAMGQV